MYYEFGNIDFLIINWKHYNYMMSLAVNIRPQIGPDNKFFKTIAIIVFKAYFKALIWFIIIYRQTTAYCQNKMMTESLAENKIQIYKIKNNNITKSLTITYEYTLYTYYTTVLHFFNKNFKNILIHSAFFEVISQHDFLSDFIIKTGPR